MEDEVCICLHVYIFFGAPIPLHFLVRHDDMFAHPAKLTTMSSRQEIQLLRTCIQKHDLASASIAHRPAQVSWTWRGISSGLEVSLVAVNRTPISTTTISFLVRQDADDATKAFSCGPGFTLICTFSNCALEICASVSIWTHILVMSKWSGRY